jgi:2-iminobutanoate/2-iminopropanoate deaminase
MNRRIATDAAPAAIGPYSQAIKGGGLVFCSGQVGLDAGSGQLVDGVEAQAEQALRNLGAVLDAAGLLYANVAKTTIFLVDMNDFGLVNAVYQRFFAEPYPARSTVAVAALPRGARVEIEAVAIVPSARDAASAGDARTRAGGDDV